MLGKAKLLSVLSKVQCEQTPLIANQFSNIYLNAFAIVNTYPPYLNSKLFPLAWESDPHQQFELQLSTQFKGKYTSIV